MTKFDIAVERVLKHEGGYVNNPKDPGGETNFGITVAVARENGYSGRMSNMTRETAKNIYKRKYWDRNRCDDMPFAVAFQVFDASVNHGVANAMRFAQQAADVADDGIVGPVTLSALNSVSRETLVLEFNARRIKFYTKLSTFSTFGKGWMNRMSENLDHAAEDLRSC